MISIEKCKAELKHSNQKYTEEEIKQIRELLYQIATIEYENFKSEQHETSSNIHEGIDRRTE